MLEFDEEPRDVLILDEKGKVLNAGDHERRFFEASWMHKYNGKYYFRIQQEILINCVTLLATHRTARLLTKELF
jgi:hypothetical protein